MASPQRWALRRVCSWSAADPTDARDTAIAAVEHYRLIPELSHRRRRDLRHHARHPGNSVRPARRKLQTASTSKSPNAWKTSTDRHGHYCSIPSLTALPAEHPRAPSWIHTAIDELGTANPMLLLYIRRLTRTDPRRRPSPVRPAVAAIHRYRLPAWAAIDQQKIDWAMGWVSAGDFTTAEAFLQQNNHLLGDDYDSAIDEAFLVVDPARAAALRDIRARLRFNPPSSPETPDPCLDRPGGHVHGNDAAQTNTYDLAEQFLEANLNQRIALLGEDGEALRGDTVGRHLRARSDSPRASAAVSLHRTQPHTAAHRRRRGSRRRRSGRCGACTHRWAARHQGTSASRCCSDEQRHRNLRT